MSNSIKIENLQNEVMKYLTNYVEDIEEGVKETTDSVTKEAKEKLKQTSPRSGLARNTKYYKGWAVKNGTKTRNGSHKYTKVIWNKTNYQLTHLLEFGHHKRDGTGWEEAQPNIRIVEEEYGSIFADLLVRYIIRRYNA